MGWELHAGRFLGGNPPEKNRKQLPSDLTHAQVRCTELSRSCSGVTCPKSSGGAEKCEPREGDPYLGESEKEDTWLKVCPNEIETQAEKEQLKAGLLGGMSAMWTDKYSFIYQC